MNAHPWKFGTVTALVLFRALAVIAICMDAADVRAQSSADDRVVEEDFLNNQCAALERRRDTALSTNNLEQLEQLAHQYIEACRPVREKDAIALAMREIAYVNRRFGQWQQALSNAQGCLGYYYLAVACHAEKAAALVGLRMSREAQDVLVTGEEVASRAEELANHQIYAASILRHGALPPGSERKAAIGRWKLSVVEFGRSLLEEVRQSISKAARPVSGS